jgi:hypothetical protein
MNRRPAFLTESQLYDIGTIRGWHALKGRATRDIVDLAVNSL